MSSSSNSTAPAAAWARRLVVSTRAALRVVLAWVAAPATAAKAWWWPAMGLRPTDLSPLGGSAARGGDRARSAGGGSGLAAPAAGAHGWWQLRAGVRAAGGTGVRAAGGAGVRRRRRGLSVSAVVRCGAGALPGREDGRGRWSFGSGLCGAVTVASLGWDSRSDGAGLRRRTRAVGCRHSGRKPSPDSFW